MKAAIKRGQSDAGISYAERERPTSIGVLMGRFHYSLLIIN